jgi:hypothetical protein
MGISGSGGGEDGAELSHRHEGGGALESLLLRLEGKLGIASERDGPYPLLRGLVRLLSYEVTKEALKEEEGSFGKDLPRKGFLRQNNREGVERAFTVWKHSIPSFVAS